MPVPRETIWQNNKELGINIGSKLAIIMPYGIIVVNTILGVYSVNSVPSPNLHVFRIINMLMVEVYTQERNLERKKTSQQWEDNTTNVTDTPPNWRFDSWIFHYQNNFPRLVAHLVCLPMTNQSFWLESFTVQQTPFWQVPVTPVP